MTASAVKGKGARDGQAALPGALIKSAKDATAWAYGVFVVRCSLKSEPASIRG